MLTTKILVVEDEGLIANDIADRLRKDGYQVTGIAASAEEALSSLSKSAPDLVLMDIRIKGDLDGIQTAERVRAGFDIPVIFLTAHADSGTLERAKVTEPYGYLVKPFRQVNLASSIEMALFKHRSEQQLRQREVWLSTVLLSSPAPTIVTDRRGVVRFVNPLAEELTVTSLMELIGKPFAEAFPLFDLSTGEPVGDLVAAALRKDCTFSFPPGLALRRPGLSDIEIEGEISPGPNEQSNPGAVITLRDCSERARQEREVRNEQKMLAVGRMAGGIAHDVNSLVASLIGESEKLLAGPLPQEQRAALEAISTAGHGAAEITGQLLALSSKPAAPRQVVAVNEVVARAVQLLSPGFGSHITVSSHLNPAAGHINIVPSQLHRVLAKLLLHAAHAMPAGGKIVLATSAMERETETLLGPHTVENFVRIAISDSGPGIEPADMNHVFEPFFNTETEDGTGLDLAVVYSIVKEAEGELNVFSAPGQGSTFEILFPSAPGPNSNPVPASLPERATILLVEAEAVLRTMTHNHFEREGYNLLEAANAGDALQIAESYEGPIHLLVTDLELPEMDGALLAAAFAAKRPEAKVIMVSAHPSSAPQPFLQKPFSLSALQQKIEQVLSAA